MASNMHGNTVRFASTTVWSIVDTTMSTALFSCGNNFIEQLSSSGKFYRFATSALEFWMFGMLRSTLLLGLTLGMVYARDMTDSMQRVRRGQYFVVAVAITMYVYSVSKALAYSELEPSSPWFWSQFAWSMFASGVLCGCHRVLLGCRISDVARGDATERTPLLGNQSSATTDSAESDDKPICNKGMTLVRLLCYARYDVVYLSVAVVFMFVSSIAEIFTPLYTGKVVQSIAINKSQEAFSHSIALMCLLSVGSALSAGVRGGFFHTAMARMNIRIRNALFSSVIRQDLGFFDTTTTGDVTSRLTSDTTTMSNVLSININMFLRSLIKAVGACVFMFMLSWRLSVATLVGLPLIVISSKLFGQYFKSISKKVQESLAQANSVAEEVCSSMRTVRSFANEDRETQRYTDKLLVTYQLKVREAVVYSGYVWCNQIFSLVMAVCTLYYGGHLVIGGRLSGGDLVSFVLYQWELSSALDAILNVYTGLMQAVGASEKVFELMDRQPAFACDGTRAPDTVHGRVEFRNVSFAYPTRPDTTVLKNVSFTVSPGEVVALVGPSGGGKSSCVNLLEHFYEAQQGQVLLDGVAVNLYNHKFLHTQMSLVSQEPVLFARSIKDNVAYGLDSWDLERVELAAKMANAHQFICEMKDKYDTETGEKGIQLSGGQKQRVAIARAVIRNPRVLLLDEATSALDSESEHVVQQAIYNSLQGRTVLIIAHRLSTVERADRIVVINKGYVVEQGSHAELLRRPSGLYAKLVRRQILGAAIGVNDVNILSMTPKSDGVFGGVKASRSAPARWLHNEEHDSRVVPVIV